MKRIDPEELLWRLSWEEGESAQPVVDKETLTAYRSGGLDEEKRRELEAHLAHSHVSREHLADLAQVESPQPSVELRERVLAAFPEVSQKLDESLKPRIVTKAKRQSWRLAWAAAASLFAVLSLAGGYRWWLGAPSAVSPPPRHEVTIAGLTTERGTTVTVQSVDAYAQTPVKIVAAAEVAQEGLEYGLYRLSPDGVERLSVGQSQGRTPIALEIYRGAAEFRATPADLVGSEPGEYRLYVVVAHSGELPPNLTLEANQDPAEALATRSRGRAYPVSLRVLAKE